MNSLITVTVAFAVCDISFRPQVAANCYQGWTHERGKCYRVFDMTVSWQQAVRECDVMDAALVMIDDITEQTFILQLRATITDVNHWIGYYNNGSNWRWLQALNTSINHLNTTLTNPGEDCAAISKMGIWNPTKCENSLPYICESETLDCLSSQGWFVYESQCLYFIAGPSGWSQARVGCHRIGADLAVLKNIYKNGVPLMHNGVTSWTWIGLKYDTMYSQYIWLDGTTSNIIPDRTVFQRSNDSECRAMDVNETSQVVLTKGFSCNVKLPGLCEKIFIPEQTTLYSDLLTRTTLTSRKNNRKRNQRTASTRYSLFNTVTTDSTAVTGVKAADGSDSHVDVIALMAQCLNTVAEEQIDDCLRDVLMSYDSVCSPDIQGKDQSADLTKLYNIEFYKNLVQHFERFIERNFDFSLCEKNSVVGFMVLEKLLEMMLDHAYPRSNFTFNDRMQFHSQYLEIALYRVLPPESGRKGNTLFESFITGCVVNVAFKNTSLNDVGIAFVVVDTGDVVQVDMDERCIHSTVQYYLVSPVLMVSAYRSGTKTSVGPTFTLAYHTVDAIAEKKHLNITQHEVTCTYYEPKRKLWSSSGCKVLDVGTYTVMCKCNHTTSFGIIMKIKVYEISMENEVALSVITYIGCSVSMVTMFIALTVFTCIRSLNSERVFVHRNLCLAILFAQVVFLAAGKATRHKIVCRVTAVVLHYCFMSIFTWMLVEGLHLYTKVVQVFGTDTSRNSYYLCFGWGLPLVLVLISTAADWEGYGTKTSCWLSVDRKTIWAFVGPAVAVIVVNLIILVMVLRVVVSSAKNDRPSKVAQTRAAIKAAIFLLHLLGLTWIFGLLAVNRQTIVFEYVFALSNSLQGFFVFLFHCVLNTEVRQALRRVRERRALLNEDIQTVSMSSDSDTSSIAVEGTLRFRLSYNRGPRRYPQHYQNTWLKEENLNRELVRSEETLNGQTQKCDMSSLPRSINSINTPLTDDHVDELPLIYI